MKSQHIGMRYSRHSNASLREESRQTKEDQRILGQVVAVFTRRGRVQCGLRVKYIGLGLAIVSLQAKGVLLFHSLPHLATCAVSGKATMHVGEIWLAIRAHFISQVFLTVAFVFSASAAACLHPVRGLSPGSVKSTKPVTRR